VLEVGNLDAVRDFTDVRDVVRAYWALVERGRAGEVYNVCSGTGLRMRDLLQALIEAAGVRVEVRVDPARLRPSDVPELVGDPGRIQAEVGWTPEIPLRRTVADLLQYWRERVAQTEPAPGPGR
jgi:GDP-4-dehydro-6-deoxy-D-mannose reductase